MKLAEFFRAWALVLGAVAVLAAWTGVFALLFSWQAWAGVTFFTLTFTGFLAMGLVAE